MKMAIISDIHGNFPALQAVFNDIEKQGIREIVSLGDICGYYCMINQCIELIREYEVFSILGNHDYYLLHGVTCNSKTVKICIDYQKKIIDERHVKWLFGLAEKKDMEKVSFRHGGWNDSLEERIENFDLGSVRGMVQSYFFSGHTHVQGIQRKDRYTYCNPGSVGQPRDHDKRAAYALMQGESIILRRVEYDIDAICFEMEKHGLGNWIWQCLYDGRRIGE